MSFSLAFGNNVSSEGHKARNAILKL